jgi:hypothetical protein
MRLRIENKYGLVVYETSEPKRIVAAMHGMSDAVLADKSCDARHETDALIGALSDQVTEITKEAVNQ